MMSNLKNLKQLSLKYPETFNASFCDILKQEAIKHWKSIMKERDKNDCIETDSKLEAQQLFIEIFFNVTSDDLQLNLEEGG